MDQRACTLCLASYSYNAGDAPTLDLLQRIWDNAACYPATSFRVRGFRPQRIVGGVAGQTFGQTGGIIGVAVRGALSAPTSESVAPTADSVAPTGGSVAPLTQPQFQQPPVQTFQQPAFNTGAIASATPIFPAPTVQSIGSTAIQRAIAQGASPAFFVPVTPGVGGSSLFYTAATAKPENSCGL